MVGGEPDFDETNARIDAAGVCGVCRECAVQALEGEW